MTNKKKVTLKELAKGLGGDAKLASAVMAGRARVDRDYDPAAVKALRQTVDDVFGDTPTGGKRTVKSKTPKEGGEVHLLVVYNPFSQTNYVALAANGTVHFTPTEEGGIDWSAADEGRLVGHDSLDDVIATTIGKQSLPSPEHIKKRKKARKKTRKKQGPRAPRKKEIFVVDPAVEAYLASHASWLAHDMNLARASPGDETDMIVDRTELERIVPSGVLDKLDLLEDYVVMAQEVHGLAKRKRGVVASARKQRLASLQENSDVRAMAHGFLKSVGTGKVRQDYLTKASNGRDIALYFTHEDRRLPGISPAEVVEVLRRLAIQRYRVREEVAQKISEASMHWVGTTLALDFVNTDDYVQQHVIPAFETGRANGHGTDPAERLFNGTVTLLERIADPDFLYSAGEFPFIVKGLWAHEKGYFMKTSRGSQTGEEALRELDGAHRQFVSPSAHLIKRLPVYEPLFRDTLDQLIDAGAILEDTPMETRNECGRIGAAIYWAIPEAVRTATFTHLDSGAPLTALPKIKDAARKDGSGTGGSTIGWVLEYWVGMRRTAIQEKIEGHYGTKK